MNFFSRIVIDEITEKIIVRFFDGLRQVICKSAACHIVCDLISIICVNLFQCKYERKESVAESFLDAINGNDTLPSLQFDIFFHMHTTIIFALTFSSDSKNRKIICVRIPL